MSGMGRHRGSEPRLQEIRVQKEISSSKEWHTGMPLGIRRGKIKIAQIVLPRSKVKDCWPNTMVDHQVGMWASARHWRKSGRGTACSRHDTTSRSCSDAATTAQQTEARKKWFGPPFERIAIDVEEPLSRSDQWK
jgi:hypothetical protein